MAMNENTRMVLIKWADSYGCSPNWEDLDGCDPQPMICYSVGWLLHDGPDAKVIVPHISDPRNSHVPQKGCGDMTISSVAIMEMVDLPAPGLVDFAPRAGLGYFLLGIAIMNIPTHISNMSIWQRISAAQNPETVLKGFRRSIYSISFSWGFLWGWLFAYLRNFFLGLTIYRVKKRMEMMAFREFLEQF